MSFHVISFHKIVGKLVPYDQFPKKYGGDGDDDLKVSMFTTSNSKSFARNFSSRNFLFIYIDVN